MRVRAKSMGYIYNVRKREGEVFDLVPVKGYKKNGDVLGEPVVYSPEQQFSDKWMEKVDADDVASESPVKKKAKKVAAPVQQDYDDEVI